MEARVISTLCVCCFLLTFSVSQSNAASHRTENFIVTAKTRQLAAEIAQAAERYRSTLAKDWLGHELPRWREPCPILAKVDPRLGAGGATSFLFETNTQRHFARPTGDGLFRSSPAGRPYGWEMSVQGSRERVLDSVLPHEVTHTIFATYFGRPLPRWADEGACTTVEHVVEKKKQHRMLYEFLTSDRGIAFNRMFAMTEYPADILPLYAQGYSLSRFLIDQGGRRKFVKYIQDGLDTNDWTVSTKNHYGYASLSELQVTWLDWVRDGSRPPRQQPIRATHEVIASRSAPGPVGPEDTHAVPATKNSRELVAVKASNKSWYASRRNTAQRDAGAPVSRVASRPSDNSPTRAVMLEWGRPSPFLTPRLPSQQ